MDTINLFDIDLDNTKLFEETSFSNLHDCENNHDFCKKSINYHSTTFNNFVAIDVEHYYPQHLTICSIGLVKYIDGKLVDSYFSLIRPPFEYPSKKGKPCTRTHHLTEADLLGERTFDLILPEVEAFVGDFPLVAHNYGTERTCLRDASAYYGLKTRLDIDNISDTKLIAQIIEKELDIPVNIPYPHELTNVCKRFGVKPLQHHQAKDDAEMCGNLMVIFHNYIEHGVIPQIYLDSEIDELRKKVLSKFPTAIRTELVNKNPFYNQKFVITGYEDKQLKNALIDRLTFLGAKKTSGISGKTQLLVCGPKPGPSKLEQAELLGIQQIDEKKLYETLLSLYI